MQFCTILKAKQQLTWFPCNINSAQQFLSRKRFADVWKSIKLLTAEIPLHSFKSQGGCNYPFALLMIGEALLHYDTGNLHAKNTLALLPKVLKCGGNGPSWEKRHVLVVTQLHSHTHWHCGHSWKAETDMTYTQTQLDWFWLHTVRQAMHNERKTVKICQWSFDTVNRESTSLHNRFSAIWLGLMDLTFTSCSWVYQISLWQDTKAVGIVQWQHINPGRGTF